MSTPDDAVTLIDELLAEQRQLTAVDRFARAHSASEFPAQAAYYRALIPLDRPRPGEQYAFAVDLDSCTGCKACVSACHSLNGLDEDETWRATGLLHGGTTAEPYQQVVTTACHHCLDPACLHGCPVLAYEKDPATGIVRHLDDQCIGCQYCLLKCPYDVPKYSAKRGIVRKCDLCHGRLAANEAPACVQACPNGAIAIRLVSQDKITRQASQAGVSLVPGAAASAYTLPTTTYASRRPLPANVAPADAHVLKRQPAHWPLVWMLLLTQAAAGIFLVSFCLRVTQFNIVGTTQTVLAAAGGLLLQVGLLSSLFHLGKPLGAWRAFLGWRRSWMSREIIVFGAFAPMAMTFALGAYQQWNPSLTLALSGFTAALGLLSIFCSAMIYVDTQRVAWRGASAFPKFFGATLLLGAAAVAALLSWTALLTDAEVGHAFAVTAWVAIGTSSALLLWEAQSLWRARADRTHPNHRSASLLWSQAWQLVLPRAVLFVLATVFGLLAIFGRTDLAAVGATASFAATFVSLMIERYAFFVTVTTPGMPGGVTS